MSLATSTSVLSRERKYAAPWRCTVDTSAGNSFSPVVTHRRRRGTSLRASRSESTRGLSAYRPRQLSNITVRLRIGVLLERGLLLGDAVAPATGALEQAAQ